MPVSIPFNENRKPNEPYITFEDDDCYYMPVGIAERADVSTEAKFCFSFIITEYLPQGIKCAMSHLSNVTVGDIVNKYNMPLVQADSIQRELQRLAPDLMDILLNKDKR